MDSQHVRKMDPVQSLYRVATPVFQTGEKNPTQSKSLFTCAEVNTCELPSHCILQATH